MIALDLLKHGITMTQFHGGFHGKYDIELKKVHRSTRVYNDDANKTPSKKLHLHMGMVKAMDNRQQTADAVQKGP